MTIYHLADVQSTNIGLNTRILQFVIFVPNAHLGSDCNIRSYVLIENEVIVDHRVTVKTGASCRESAR